MKLRYDLGSMTPGVLVSPRVDEVDLTLTGGLNSFTLRGSAATIRVSQESGSQPVNPDS